MEQTHVPEGLECNQNGFRGSEAKACSAIRLRSHDQFGSTSVTCSSETNSSELKVGRHKM